MHFILKTHKLLFLRFLDHVLQTEEICGFIWSFLGNLDWGIFYFSIVLAAKDVKFPVYRDIAPIMMLIN